MVNQVSVLEVPFNSAGTASGVARMPDALVQAGLYDALGRHAEVISGRVGFPSADPVRGPAGLIAEPALVAMVENLSAATRAEVSAGRWPLIVGGDCAVLLGALLGAKVEIEVGLLFVDGHEDAWPPKASTTGETADCELGLAMGFYQGPAGLQDHLPLVSPDRVVALGPRDHEELLAKSVDSIAPHVLTVPAHRLVKGDIASIARDAATRLRTRTGQWWLHIDLDVLSTEALRAIDYPQPGGLSWPELDELVVGALQGGGCMGASVVIYNPDLDNGVHAGAIVRFLERLVTTAISH